MGNNHLIAAFHGTNDIFGVFMDRRNTPFYSGVNTVHRLYFLVTVAAAALTSVEFSSLAL